MRGRFYRALSFRGKDMLSGSMYAREARPHITKGGEK